MNYFKERFGFDEIRFSYREKIELNKKLKELDYKRVEFFAIVSLLTSCIFIFLDFADYYPSVYKIFYLISDFVLLIVSLIITLFTILYKNQEKRPSLNRILLNIYPIISILWAAGIASLDQSSMINMLTFIIVFFILTFLLTPTKFVYSLFFVSYLLVYGFLCLIKQQPFFSETLVLMILGSFITIPFYSTFRTTRKNSVGGLIKLNRSNKNLEHEVSSKMDQLKVVNEELGNEIVQRKIIELKLRKALEKAEASEKLKSEFLANISHEIRTPLNAIIGFSEMLTEDGVAQEQKVEFQKLVSSNTMFLLSAIDDIFDASMANTQQIKTISSYFNINKFIDSISYETTGIILKYNSPNILLSITKLEENNLELFTDEFYLRKALLRLIDNAYKFTSEGNIEIGVMQNKSKIKFYVKDTGIGIAKDDMEKIFEPFVQGDGSYTRDYGGIGLGLTIVNGIVKELECDFNLKSEKGEGTTFFISFNNSTTKLGEIKMLD